MKICSYLDFEIVSSELLLQFFYEAISVDIGGRKRLRVKILTL